MRGLRYLVLWSRPAPTVKGYATSPFERLLSIPNVVLPALAEVDACDHAVNRIVAEIRMDGMDQRMQFSRRQRATLLQQIENSVAEYPMRCPALCASP
jgi:hypothetical protein